MSETDKLIRCQNYSLCKEIVPEWMRRCTKCDVSFGEWNNGKGILKEFQNHECPICLETKTCFEQPKCKHPICSDCFRVIYFGEVPDELIESRIGKEPEYPYQDILDQNKNMDYCDIEKNPTEYPLIIEYNERWNIWNRLRERIIEELMTETCCLCRVA